MKKLFIILSFIIPSVMSCTYLKIATGVGFKKPEVRLTEITIDRFDFRELSLNFILEIKNPNNFSLNTDRIRYVMNLAGIDIIEGELNDALHIPAKGIAALNLPARIKNKDVMQLIGYMTRQGGREVPAKIEGSLYLPGLLAIAPVNFKQERNLSL